jgi:hypothetical protein
MAAALLVAGIIAIAWLAAPLLTKHVPPPTRLPTALAAPAGPNTADGRLEAAEQNLKDAANERSGLMAKIAQAEKALTAGIRRARAETTALVEGVKRDMNRSFEAVHSRVTSVESSQREAHDQVARLQSDLEKLHIELENVRQAGAQQSAKVNEIEHSQHSIQSEVSEMRQQAHAGQRRMDALSYQVDRDTVGFEVSRNQPHEVLPGIYLTVNRTNIGKQQVDGWLHIAGAGRFIWLEAVGALHPLSFTSFGDERPYHLVFTRIADGTAAGYIQVPAAPVDAKTAAD